MRRGRNDNGWAVRWVGVEMRWEGIGWRDGGGGEEGCGKEMRGGRGLGWGETRRWE